MEKMLPETMPGEEFNQQIDKVAEMMEEFGLSEATLSGEDWKISFKKRRAVKQVKTGEAAISEDALIPEEASQYEAPAPAAKSGPTGTPVTSPMNGIFYTAPSPSAPAFVKEGEPVTAGQVVGLIEAMKVFNEIVAPLSGTVEKIVAGSGDLVSPGDPLIYIK